MKIIGRIKNLLFTDLSSLLKLFERAGINAVFFLIPILLSFAAALFEGISLGLLVPLVEGVIKMDFSFVLQYPAVRMFQDTIGSEAQLSDKFIFAAIVVTIFISVIVKNALQYISAVTLHAKLAQLLSNLQQKILKKYLSFEKAFFDSVSAGHLSDIMLNYTWSIVSQLSHTLRPVTAVFMVAVYGTLLFAISWKLTLISSLILPPLYFVILLLIKKIRYNSRALEVFRQKLSTRVNNILTGFVLVKASGFETSEEQRFGELSRKFANAQLGIQKKQELIPAIQEILVTIALLFLISVTAHMVMSTGDSRVAGFMVFFVILKRLLNSTASVNIMWSVIAGLSGPINAILEILDRKEDVSSEGCIEFRGIERSITFRDLNFSYDAGKPVLKGFNLTIESGKVTALVGRTGGGKTSIAHLLLRFYDAQGGSILFDDVEVRHFRVDTLRSRIALVSQETILFNDTLRMNILYGVSEPVSEIKLGQTLEKAQLTQLITKLPQGLDTVIGDRGVKLSGGEKQRIAIARAIMRNASIVILDEATSALDSLTERAVQDCIEQAMAGATVIVIAHRLNTVKKADKIVVMEEGAVVEQGTYGELMERKSRFYAYSMDQKLR